MARYKTIPAKAIECDISTVQSRDFGIENRQRLKEKDLVRNYGKVSRESRRKLDDQRDLGSKRMRRVRLVTNEKEGEADHHLTQPFPFEIPRANYPFVEVVIRFRDRA
jgi:hypothetical protein